MKSVKLLAVLLCVSVVFVAVVASAQQPPPPPPPYGAQMTFEQAKKAMAAAEAEAQKNNWAVVIAILDAGGNLMMLSRLDNAQWGSIEVAKAKAKAAVAFRRPTKVFQDLIAQGGANLRLLNLTGDSGVLEGGVPVIVDGKVIGGIGVSGVTSAQDAQIAMAGTAAIGGK